MAGQIHGKYLVPLGKRFGKRTPEVAAVVTALEPDALRALEAGRPVGAVLAGEPIEILPEDVVIEREVTSDWLVQSAGTFVVALDPTVTPDLARAGLAREVVSRVQRLRKDAGYRYTVRIALGVAGDAEVLAAVREHEQFIRGETLARSLEVGDVLDPCDARDEARIDDTHAILTVRQWT